MYNRNFGEFDYVRPLGIAKACAKPKIKGCHPETDGYTRPSDCAKTSIIFSSYFHDIFVNYSIIIQYFSYGFSTSI